MGEYSKSAIIKYARKYTNMTQEELSEYICDPVTLSRYESGKLEPSQEKFSRIMQRMGMSGDAYVVPIQVADNRHEELMNDILYGIESYNFDSVREKLQTLKELNSFDLNYAENLQCVQRVELILELVYGNIDQCKYIEGLKSALRLTFKDYDDEKIDNETFFVHRVFTETELMILINIASEYGSIGNAEFAIKLYEKIEEYYMSGVVVNDYKPRYIELLSYANVLGLSGYHDRSIEICKRGIQWLLKHNKSNYLYNFYYNIGWNIKKKIDNAQESIDMLRIAKCYVWLGSELCKMYPENQENYRLIMEFYEENF